MKEDAMLHVITGALLTGAQTGELLRTLRHMQPRSEGRRHMLLLVCDLPDAPACVMPDDAPLLRAIQSGVMAICARSQGETALLVTGGAEHACTVAWSDGACVLETDGVRCRGVIGDDGQMRLAIPVFDVSFILAPQAD